MKKAFTLVEILIVVAILGILAALVLPTLQGHIAEAKEAAAKDNLRILRNAIELYASRNNDIPPGYPQNDPSLSPGNIAFALQMIGKNKYLPELPTNPFSGENVVKLVGNDEEFPAEPPGTHLYGWIYQPATKTIKLIWPGTDKNGIRYYDY